MNIIKYIIEKVNIRYSDIDVFRYFVKLKLFNSKVADTLWTALRTPILNIVGNIKGANGADQIEEEYPLIHFQKIKMFEQDLNFCSQFKNIDDIFK